MEGDEHGGWSEGYGLAFIPGTERREKQVGTGGCQGGGS